MPVFRAPEGHDPKEPLPLVVLLHGYGAGAIVQSLYFGLEPLVDREKFLLIAPDGTPDSKGSRFWNAVDTCCDFDGKGVDDVAYLTGLVEEVASVWAVDRKRVYAIGHSNGGAMSYRLACDAAETFAAVVTLAPPFYSDVTKCVPKQPVAVRHMHGTADETVAFEGDDLGPGARKVVEAWAAWNGCDPTPDESAPAFDLDRGVPGAETTVSKYGGCKSNADVELWTMTGSTHIPADLKPEFGQTIWDFLKAHPKP